METTEIVFLPDRGLEVDSPRLLNAILEVKRSKDSVILGLTSKMTRLLQERRGRLEHYMGSRVSYEPCCREDAQVLLARILLDRSSHGSLPGYVEYQLQNRAYDFFDKGADCDPFRNWMRAEDEYLKDGLSYLESLQKRNATETP